jgi:hypothetical protein
MVFLGKIREITHLRIVTIFQQCFPFTSVYGQRYHQKYIYFICHIYANIHQTGSFLHCRIPFIRELNTTCRMKGGGDKSLSLPYCPCGEQDREVVPFL